MPIDVFRDKLLTLREAAEHLPGRPHVSTVWRWVLRGVRGTKLTTVVRGGRRFTSQEALVQFIAHTTAAAGGEPGVAGATKGRVRAVQDAERELAEDGI